MGTFIQMENQCNGRNLFVADFEECYLAGPHAGQAMDMCVEIMTHFVFAGG